MAQFITVAGIDVSKASLDIALWPQDEITLRLDRGDADCFDRLVTWLTQHDVHRVGLEASGGYEHEVLEALQARGVTVVRYNAKRIRDFAKALGRLAKNDRVDAKVIAHATSVLPRLYGRRHDTAWAIPNDAAARATGSVPAAMIFAISGAIGPLGSISPSVL